VFRRRGEQAIKFGAVLLIGSSAGLLAATQYRGGLALSALVMLLFVVSVRWTRGRLPFSPYRWIPWAWVGLFLVADLRFEFRTPVDVVSGDVTREQVVQVTLYALVGALTVHTASLLPRQRWVAPRALFLAWPLLALASALWSPIPVFTIVRALQLLVLVSLALLVFRIWLAFPSAGRFLWRTTLRLFVGAVTVLVVLGFLIPSVGSDERFTWPGVHPITAATYVAVALLILLVGGRSVTGFPAWSYFGRLFLLGAALYLSQTRSVVIALLLAVLVALWFAGRDKPVKRYLGVMYYLLGAALLIAFLRVELVQYFLRGGNVETVATFTGRIPLWEVALGELSAGDRWMIGFGYGSPRVLLYSRVEWAGTTHSSWIELLFSIGIVGLLLATADMLILFRNLSRRGVSGDLGTLPLVVLIFLLVVSTTSETLALPGMGFGLLALLHVPALIRRFSIPAVASQRDDEIVNESRLHWIRHRLNHEPVRIPGDAR
jgi:O-antigen ligase